MNSYENRVDKKREELERRINDAAEGLLGYQEIDILEQELTGFPDLEQDYRDIMRMPDLSSSYGRDLGRFNNEQHIEQIKKLIQNERPVITSFEEVTVNWFRKYALAASFLIVGLTSLTNYYATQSFFGLSEVNVTDILYPFEESDTDAYAIYLDQLIGQ